MISIYFNLKITFREQKKDFLAKNNLGKSHIVDSKLDGL